MTAIHTYALTTLADVKESLGIDAGNTASDNLIIRKINQATDMIERYCGLNTNQHFAATTYTNEEYDGSGSNQLTLKTRPVITLTSFQGRNTIDNTSSWTSIDSTLYFLDSNAGVIDLLFTALNYWNYYRVTYQAGFSTIPSDLSEACVMMASFFVENGTTGAAIKSKRQGPKQIDYYDSSSGGNASIFDQLGLDDILSAYMSWPILADK